MASWAEIRNGIFAGESGGDPNALYGYANRPGGRFAGVNVSDMSVADVMAFTDPRGEYAQHVKSQIGRVATPVGNFQVVGSTLRDAVKGMGLTGTEKFDAATQDAIGQWIYSQQGTGAWEGYKGPQSGGSAMGLLSTGMPEQAPQTFGQRIKSGFQDGSLFDSMAMAFNGLRMNPDQNLGQVVGQRQEMRQQNDVMNRTVAWLQSMGTPQAMQAAEALATGSIDAGSAVQYALAEPEAGQRGLVVGSNIVDPVTGEVIYQGPEKVVDDAPATFRALDLQARAANLKPKAEGGDGQYESFMLTRGTGYAAEASSLGSARGEAIAGAPAKAEMAGMIETQIDELLNDPYLPEMLGPYASRMPNVSGDAARVQSKMDQITGGAFLQARQLLKGGGGITDFESKKAESAFIRMNAAQNEADFRTAMEDFRSAVRSGLPKLDAQGGAVAAPAGPRIKYDAQGNRLP
jgi:hypothetical protein